MNKKTKLLSILGLVTAILFLFSSEVLAQSLSISGKVIDKNSQEPVIGASVLIEGTSNGTITDLDGNFMLSNVPSKGNLVVSYIGYVSQEIPLKSSLTLVMLHKLFLLMGGLVSVLYWLRIPKRWMKLL